MGSFFCLIFRPFFFPFPIFPLCLSKSFYELFLLQFSSIFPLSQILNFWSQAHLPLQSVDGLKVSAWTHFAHLSSALRYLHFIFFNFPCFILYPSFSRPSGEAFETRLIRWEAVKVESSDNKEWEQGVGNHKANEVSGESWELGRKSCGVLRAGTALEAGWGCSGEGRVFGGVYEQDADKLLHGCINPSVPEAEKKASAATVSGQF